MHRLLRRQLQRCFSQREPPPELAAFVAAVDEAYKEADADRHLLERSLDLTSAELLESNEQLRADLEETRRIQEQLRVSDRMASVGMLAAAVAHEINNPLGYVLANVEHIIEQLQAEGRTRDELRSCAGEALDGALRVQVIVRDLMVFSHPREEPSPGPIDVGEVLQSAVRMSANQVRHRASLVQELESEQRVTGHASRLGQVFLNLLINAAQALPVGRTVDHEIRVTTRDEDGRVVIEVADTGPGIPEELLERVFDPFTTTKDPGVGTGLGLSISRNIVESMGGTISAHRRVPRGTLMRISLPAATSPAAPSRPPTGPLGIPTELQRVLVVDDERLLAEGIRRMLRGLQVTALTSGREALELLSGGAELDLVLCDLMIPDLSGMDLYRQVVAKRPELAQRFVFMSGGCFTAEARGFLDEHGAVAIAKPFRRHELAEVLRRRVETPAIETASRRSG